eukprot:jgi/Tetstr1/446118/TSEL_033718.t1
MRHRVRRQWWQWQDIGASDQVLRWIQEGVRIPFKHNRPLPNFHNGIIMQDATPAQLTFLAGELARFVESGAWEFGTCRKWVSRLFLVPKPGVNQWRCIVDLCVLNSYCVRKRLKMETLLGVRHQTKKGDYMFSFNLQDGFYALGIAEADRDYFIVDVRGQLYMLAGMPMGWSLSLHLFVTLTQVFITHLRKPEPEPPSLSTQPTRSKRYLRRTRWRGARILPYVDDFLLFSASMEQALHLRKRLASLLDALGLQRNPTKGFWEPCQFGRHLGVDIDSASGMFYAPADTLNRLSRQAARLIGRATGNARWLPVRELQSLAGQAQYLFLAIPAARPFLRELHSVVGDRWLGRARPDDATAPPRPTVVDIGGVLNGRLKARGFLSSADERQHITWKELKALQPAHTVLVRRTAQHPRMEDPNVAASVTVRVANTGLGWNYDVILGSTFDLRTEKWLAENTCVDWLREVLLDTKKPELELHAAQLDDLFVTKKWSALNFLRQVGTDSTTTLRYTLTPPEHAARIGRQPISAATEGPTVHESLMLNHARLKTHLPSKVAHKRMYGNHSMFNNLVDMFAAHGVCPKHLETECDPGSSVVSASAEDAHANPYPQGRS